MQYGQGILFHVETDQDTFWKYNETQKSKKKD